MRWLASKIHHASELKAEQEQLELEACNFEVYSLPLPKIYGKNAVTYPSHCCLGSDHSSKVAFSEQLSPEKRPTEASLKKPSARKQSAERSSWNQQDFESVRMMIGGLKDHLVQS